ncbi:hypothetical protein KAR91_64455 [Candidatus Pacearchaeota archaeon]|nr:hypothetical protein [Candidatus Pacearchaeota archaeon]
MDDKNKNQARVVIVCGARCVFQEKGYCKKATEPVVITIGSDGKCIRFETK